MPRAILTVSTLLALMVGPVAAQTPPGQSGFGNGFSGLRLIDFTSLPTPTQLAGPEAPATMRQILALDSAQTEAYRARWSRHMDSTRALRDTAKAAERLLQGAMDRRERDAAKQSADALRSLWKPLRSSDEEFARSGLEPLLTKAQRDEYRRYVKQWKEAAKQEQRDRMGAPNRGGRRPPSG